MDLRHKAGCCEEDPELFFPVGNSGPALAQIADAKLVCNRCPVTTECLSWALNTGQDSGVWGGMSEDERRALKRRNARTKARRGVCPKPTQQCAPDQRRGRTAVCGATARPGRDDRSGPVVSRRFRP